MANNNQQMTASERIVAEARKHQTDREKTYRGQALKMYPWVCGPEIQIAGDHHAPVRPIHGRDNALRFH
jgi:hypothetical protein